MNCHEVYIVRIEIYFITTRVKCLSSSKQVIGTGLKQTSALSEWLPSIKEVKVVLCKCKEFSFLQFEGSTTTQTLLDSLQAMIMLNYLDYFALQNAFF